jgi:aspartate kinase
MITQGSSELNLAFVVKNSDTNTAVQALHNEFELSKIN